jgi:SAM-dependent MidA family methyltransferase
MNQGRFVWARMKSKPKLGEDLSVPSDVLRFLPDGFVREICPSAQEWWRSAAGLLRWGKLMTIDYGLLAEELVRPERKAGTLRAYQRHTVTNDLLAAPGEQDITAHVDFTAIQRAGETAGLKTEQFTSQEQFLMRIIDRAEKNRVAVGDWSPGRKRQLPTLISPEHLGRFRVLVQGVGQTVRNQ